jgi:hypothetical protein
MKINIQDFVATYDTFQRNKSEIVNISRSLKSLAIPTHIWNDISMDFIVELPRVGKKYMIMVLVNFLSKYAHFCALPHPFTPSLVSQVLLYHIFKLHGISTFIVSDGDPTFTSKFWQDLFKLHRSQIKMNIAYHPQIDGQTKVVNKFLETYL